MLIVTKTVGPMESTITNYKDVTSNYKYDEGSEQERKSFEKALREVGLSLDILQMRSNDIKNDIVLKAIKKENQTVGEQMSFSYFVQNNREKEVSLNVSATLNSIYYTGDKFMKVKHFDDHVKLAPGESKLFLFMVVNIDVLTLLRDGIQKRNRGKRLYW